MTYQLGEYEVLKRWLDHQYHVMISCVSYLPPTELPVVQFAGASPFNSTAITVQWEVRAMHTIHVAGVAVVMYNVHDTVIMWYM